MDVSECFGQAVNVNLFCEVSAGNVTNRHRLGRMQELGFKAEIECLQDLEQYILRKLERIGWTW